MKSAMDIALELLSRRSATQNEIEKRLRDKKIAPKEIGETISRLREWGYIDDYSLATQYCRSHSGRHTRLKIRQDLLLRGIDSTLIDEVVNNSYPREQEFQLCLNHAQQIWEREKQYLAKHKIRNKAYKNIPREILLQHKVGIKLARLGYPYEMIKQVLVSMANEK